MLRAAMPADHRDAPVELPAKGSPDVASGLSPRRTRAGEADGASRQRGRPVPAPRDASGDGFEGYFPRSQLSVAPQPLAPVVVPFPDGAAHAVRYTTVLKLYIDEAGMVQRADVDGPPLSPVFEDAARTAFLAARFRPGQRDGHSVRSMVRVEVTFDSTPLTK
jgi:hypothetical protein